MVFSEEEGKKSKQDEKPKEEPIAEKPIDPTQLEKEQVTMIFLIKLNKLDLLAISVLVFNFLCQIANFRKSKKEKLKKKKKSEKNKSWKMKRFLLKIFLQYLFCFECFLTRLYHIMMWNHMCHNE